MEHNGSSIGELMKAWNRYRSARLDLLSHLHRPESRRDPSGEWSEMLVKQLLNGRFPLKPDGQSVNPVQRSYDIILEDGTHIQVKSLSNPDGKWVNEHEIKFTGQVDTYAIVFFKNLRPEVIIVFPKHQLKYICERLGKKHGEQDIQLKLTQRDFELILAERDDFVGLGLRIWSYETLQQQWKEWIQFGNDTEQRQLG